MPPVIPKKIRSSVILLAASFLFVVSANAQDVPLASVFVGASLAAPFDSNHDDAPKSGFGPTGEINFNLNRHLGAFYGFTYRQGRPLDENLVGIRFFIGSADSFRYYTHAIVGSTSGKGGGFVAGGGTGFDLSVSHRIGFRVFDVEILSTGETAYFRASAGLVVNFGRR
jgi:hypothetical protein